VWPQLGEQILRTLQLNEPDDLIGWPRLPPRPKSPVSRSRSSLPGRIKDKIASDILAAAADSLARNAVTCARKLSPDGTRVQFVLAGSIVLRQPRFGSLLMRELLKLWPNAAVIPLHVKAFGGQWSLAKRFLRTQGIQSPKVIDRSPKRPVTSFSPKSFRPLKRPIHVSLHLDRLGISEGMNRCFRRMASIAKN